MSIGLILSRIEEQLTRSSNQAANHIVQDTLVRYKKSMIDSPNGCQERLAHYLTWDTVWECPFANFDQIRDEERVIKKIRQINEWLLKNFHDKKHEGLDLSLYRLSDKVMKQLLSEDSGKEVKWKKPFRIFWKKERTCVTLM